MSLTAILLYQLPLALVVNRLLSRIGTDPKVQTVAALEPLIANLEDHGYRVQSAVIGKHQISLAYIDPDGKEGQVSLRRRRNGTLVAPLPR